MTTRKASSQVVLALMILGTACIGMRRSFRNPSEITPGDSVWRLTYSAEFHARQSGARLRAAFPETTRHCRVFEHRTSDSGLLFSQHRPSRAAGELDIVGKAPKPGQYTFQAQFDIHLSQHGGNWPSDAIEKTSADGRAKHLASEKGIPVDAPIVGETLARLLEDQPSRDDLIERIFTHCREDIGPGGDSGPQDAAEALTQRTANPLGRARAMVALCRAAKIPARLVAGFEMVTKADARPHTWVEVLLRNRWEPCDPVNGSKPRALPYYYVPVLRDAVDVVRVNGASGLAVKYTVSKLPAMPGTGSLSHRNPLNILDLNHLPARLHEVIAVILLLPLGALVTAFFRTIVGVRTFGTFSPTLLALAFVFNDWRTGLVVFVTVLIVGFTSRSLLDRLKLLLVPRLGIILTLVVLLMVFGVSIMNYYQLTPLGEIVLLPMVILTMLIERFFVTTEEDSLKFATELLLTTLSLAFIVYLLLRWKAVGRLVLTYPEIHCFTVALLVLMGRYTGYRWSELWRFRDFAKPEK